MIEGLFNTGDMPVLERMVQFTAARHRVLVDNIANLSTPGFRPRQMSPASFQQALGDAVDRRRREQGGPSGDITINDTADLRFGADSVASRHDDFADQDILFHDQNNRSLERQMQALAENTMAHNAAVELLKADFALLENAIREMA